MKLWREPVSRQHLTKASVSLFLATFKELKMQTRKTGLMGLGLAAAVSLSAVVIPAGSMAQDKIQDQTNGQDKLQTQDRTQDMIYGSQLMRQAERNQYRAQMRNLKTAQEREAFRLQHHEQMKVRAQEKGVVLPDHPPMGGAGLGPRVGAGVGAGMGSGAGNGAGPGAGAGKK
jgi:hypothetical protein